MSFTSSYSQIANETKRRVNGRDGLLSFGIQYLDDAMLGILRNDLILIGGGSGGGKTQLCTNIALSNVALGKRIHYIALEAEYLEIEGRIKYQLFVKHFYSDINRPQIRINFQKWMVGDYFESCTGYEIKAATEFEEKYRTLFTYYKSDKFDVTDLIQTVCEIEDETDLIILDHVHYMDIEVDENENSAIKKIAKTARMLAIEKGKPIILVSHVRKRDKYSGEYAPGLEEFHGSSDLYKIATKAITIGPGRATSDGKLETYLRIVKNRFDGSCTRVMGQILYDPKVGSYGKEYYVGDAYQTRAEPFNQLSMASYPEWATYHTRASSGDDFNIQKPSAIISKSRGKKSFQASQRKDLE